MVKKGLSRAFTREIVSEENLAPSDFNVIPIKLNLSYDDSPIEDIQKHKRILESPKIVNNSLKDLEEKNISQEIVLDREKIDRIVVKLNSLKKIQAEKVAAQMQKEESSLQKDSSFKGDSLMLSKQSAIERKQVVVPSSNNGKIQKNQDSFLKSKKEDSLTQSSF